MEANRSQDCRMSYQTGHPKEPVVSSSLSWEVWNQQRHWCGSCLRASRLETPEELMFYLESKDRNKPVSQSEGSHSGNNSLLHGGGSAFSSSQAFNWLDEAHPHKEAWCALPSLLIYIWISSKNSHRSSRMIFDQISRCPRAKSSWHIKLSQWATIALGPSTVYVVAKKIHFLSLENDYINA